jgi:NADPH-dependent curcumin reductase CurA
MQEDRSADQPAARAPLEPLAMKNNRNRQVILKSRPADIPQPDNFEIIESDVPDLRTDESWCTILIFRSNPPCAAG